MACKNAYFTFGYIPTDMWLDFRSSHFPSASSATAGTVSLETLFLHQNKPPSTEIPKYVCQTYEELSSSHLAACALSTGFISTVSSALGLNASNALKSAQFSGSPVLVLFSPVHGSEEVTTSAAFVQTEIFVRNRHNTSNKPVLILFRKPKTTQFQIFDCISLDIPRRTLTEWGLVVVVRLR